MMQHYKVHGSQLGWAMAALNAAGIAHGAPQKLGDSMYMIVVQLPEAAAEFDHRTAATPPRRRTWRAPSWRGVVQLVCVLVIVGGLLYGGYGLMSAELATTTVPASGPATLAGLPVETGGMRLDDGAHMAAPTAGDLAGVAAQAATGAVEDAQTWIAKATAPPAPAVVPAPWWRVWNQEPDVVQPEKAGGWLPKNPVGDAVDGIMQMVMWATYAAIAFGVLWVAAVVAGIVGKVRGK